MMVEVVEVELWVAVLEEGGLGGVGTCSEELEVGAGAGSED